MSFVFLYFLFMTLYIYDHCPYCVKARMIFGFKNESVELKTLLNDDEKTPIAMIGVKMVPILEYEPKKFMPESMDIVDFIDKKELPQQVQTDEDPQLLNWISQNNGINYKLAMPRWVKSPLREFQTASARDYFEKKKTAYIGSFKDCLAESHSLISQMEKELETLESLLKAENTFFQEKLSWNDFHLFPFLRSLSIVKGLSFATQTRKYMENLSELSQIPLHFDIATNNLLSK